MEWIKTNRREKNYSENYFLTHFKTERLLLVGGFLLKHRDFAE